MRATGCGPWTARIGGGEDSLDGGEGYSFGDGEECCDPTTIWRRRGIKEELSVVADGREERAEISASERAGEVDMDEGVEHGGPEAYTALDGLEASAASSGVSL